MKLLSLQGHHQNNVRLSVPKSFRSFHCEELAYVRHEGNFCHSPSPPSSASHKKMDKKRKYFDFYESHIF